MAPYLAHLWLGLRCLPEPGMSEPSPRAFRAPHRLHSDPHRSNDMLGEKNLAPGHELTGEAKAIDFEGE